MYLNFKATQYLKQEIFTEEARLNILRFLFFLISNEHHSLIQFSNLNPINFVATFKSLGSFFFNFLIKLAHMTFSNNNFRYANYNFLSQLIQKSFVHTITYKNKHCNYESNLHDVKGHSDDIKRKNEYFKSQNTTDTKERLKGILSNKEEDFFLQKSVFTKEVNEHIQVYCDNKYEGDIIYRNIYYTAKLLKVVRSSLLVLTFETLELVHVLVNIKSTIQAINERVIIILFTFIYF